MFPTGPIEVELFMRVGDGPIRPTGKALIPVPSPTDEAAGGGDQPERWGWQDGADPPESDQGR